MAYPLSRAMPEAHSVPLPTSPVVWAGYARRTYCSCLLLAFLWAMAITMLGFFFPLGITHLLDDVVHFVPGLLFVAALVGALALGKGIGNDFKYVQGYGTIKRTSDSKGRTVVSVRGRRIVYAAVLAGLFAGCLIAAVIRVATGHWLGFLVLAALALVLLLPALKVGRLARIVWQQTKTDQRIHRDIVASGHHSVGTVMAVTNEAFTVENRAMFHVDLEYETGGRLETTRIQFFDYPVWAPALGNEFDVWTDPERPFVEDRTVLERRYVGQKFAKFEDVPVSGDHSSNTDDWDADRGVLGGSVLDGSVLGRGGLAGGGLAGGDSAGEKLGGGTPPGVQLLPQWMVDEADPQGPSTPKDARRTRILIGIPPTLIAVAALAGTLLVPVMVADVPWWTMAALWFYTVLTLINAAVYWQFMVRSRWFLRSGVTFGATETAVFAGFFAAGFAMLTTHSMVMAPLQREIPWTAAHVLTWAAVIGALLVFEWAFTSNGWALKHLNAEFPAPPEAIQEALTGHDGLGIDKLETEYGYRAGVFLCT